MEARAEDPRAGAGFGGTDARDGRRAVGRGAARAVGDGHVVRLPSGLVQQAERPGHQELDVVGVRGQRQRDVAERRRHQRGVRGPSFGPVGTITSKSEPFTRASDSSPSKRRSGAMDISQSLPLSATNMP